MPIVSGAKLVPTAFSDLLAWYALPPKRMIASPDTYLTRTRPSYSFPTDVSNAAWTKINSSVSTGISDPFGGTNAQKIIESTATGNHNVQQTPTNFISRKIKITAYYKAAERTQAYLYCYAANAYFDLVAGTIVVTGGSNFIDATITDAGNGWFYCTLTSVGTSGAIPQYGVANGGVASYTGDGTSGVYVYNPGIEQDGVISQLNDLSGNGYHATQATFANSHYYMGELEADWSTGAPTLYNPDAGTLVKLDLPAGLVTALGGTDPPIEIVYYGKMYSKLSSSLMQFFQTVNGGTSELLIGRHTSSNRQYYRANDLAASQNVNWLTDLSEKQEVISENWDSTSANLYVGYPPIDDGKNPVAVTVTGAFTATSANICRSYTVDGTGAHALREMAIFSRKLTVNEREAVMFGMRQRSF